MSFQTNYFKDFQQISNVYLSYADYYNTQTLNLVQTLIYQNQLLKQRNMELENNLRVAQEENERIKFQINSQKNKRTSVTTVNKRKYSKRRTWLEKKHICPSSECGNKYSSTIALNLHIRKHHLVED